MRLLYRIGQIILETGARIMKFAVLRMAGEQKKLFLLYIFLYIAVNGIIATTLIYWAVKLMIHLDKYLIYQLGL